MLHRIISKTKFLLAQTFGRYVEVDKPTLRYRAYLWRGQYYFVDRPFALSVHKPVQHYTGP